MGVREAIKRKFSKVNEESLPPGYYTLGDGKVRKIPTEGFSKWYKRGDYSFRYNYATKSLECYYIDRSSKIDELGLSFTNWIDNPDYWVDNYLNQIEEEAKSLGYYEESKKLKESIKKVFSKRVDETQYYFPNGSKATNEDVIDALAYMYGVSVSKVKNTIGTYDRDSIIKAIAYYSTKGYNPKKKQELYKSNIEDIKSLMGIKESSSIRESESYVIAYREGGQDKFSSVTANSSSEALQIFNAAVDKAGRNVNNVHIAVEDVDITESLPPIRDYKVVRTIDNEPTELTTVRARNEEEAKANMLLALLDAGYYEDEVTPEIEDGTITVQLDECDDLKEEDECKTAYVVSECIYNEDGSTETKPLFSIRADSPEEAQSRLVKCAREHGISDLSNLVLHEYDAEVASTLLNKIYEDDKDTKKAFRIRYKYNYVEETDESPYVRSAVFEAPLIVVANDSEEALNKAMSMSNEIANKNRYMDGEPYNFEIEAVYDSLEDYKSKYRMSNIPVVECDDLSESVDYDTYKYYITIRPETPNPTKMDDLKVKLKQEDILPVYVSARYSPDGKKYRDSYGWIYLLKSKEDYDKLLDISTEVLGSKDGINVKPLEFNKSEWDIRESNEDFEDDTIFTREVAHESIPVNKRVVEGNIFETPDGVDAHLQGNRHDEGLTLDDLNKAQYSSSMMNDRAEVHVDGRSYVKVSEDQWEYHPTQERALGYKVTTDRLWNEIIQNAERVDFYP